VFEERKIMFEKRDFVLCDSCENVFEERKIMIEKRDFV
jgi:hypothetical protein